MESIQTGTQMNTTSAKLAEKLGYEFDKAYDTYFVDNR